MKRYTLLILTVLMLAPLLPLAEPTDELNEEQKRSWSSGQYTALLYSYEKIVNLSSGGAHTCGILDNSAVSCWGRGVEGQLGNGVALSQYSPTLTSSLGANRTAVAISSGGYHTCAILDSGEVSCWGRGAFGQLGNGGTSNQYSPTLTNSLGTNRTAVAISSGFYHTCVILDSGEVSCWGDGSSGKLGNGAALNQNSPTLTSSLGSGRTAVALSSGYMHTCAILDNGAVSCWGKGSSGQLGKGGASDKTTPTLTSSLGAGRTAVAISLGYYHTCAILDNASVSCWGLGSDGQLGNGAISNQNSPTLTSSLGANRTAVALSSGGSRTCALLDNGSVSCWGHGASGQLGNGATSSQNVPTLTRSLGTNRTAVALSSGPSHTCAILDNNAFFSSEGVCWGSGSSGQLGNGGSSSSLMPTPRELLHVSAIEGQSMNYNLKGSIFDNINLSQTTISLDTPVGLLFDQMNLSLTGSPAYTSQTQWNITLTNITPQRTSMYTLQILADTDGDGVPNSLDNDDDGDGYSDSVDVCPTQLGNSTVDVLGCPDADGDGYSNSGDSFANDATQFADTDQDGFGDNASGNLPDGCPSLYGDSSRGDLFGCPDSDGDRWADLIDVFVNDLSQWNDSDSDGFGDSLIGFQGDACPTTSGTSTQDRFGCLDSDNDGWSNDGDLFTNNPTQWADRDGDGYGDNQSTNASPSDAFPADGTQWEDADGDGHGDNPYGTQGDWFPYDPSRWQDSDADGIADEDDAFDNENSQSEDRDGDGYGDNPNGNRADQFPDDPLEWFDNDGDGFGNNQDAFPTDGTQWNDTDGDGHGDNPFGSQGDWFPDNPDRWQDSDRDGVAEEDDAFPNDPSQFFDSDGDGYGDDPNGSDADAFPNDRTEWFDSDRDGTGDNTDDLPLNPSQITDSDGDGFGDSLLGTGADPFPNDPTQWLDADGDQFGDNLAGENADFFPRDITQWFDQDGDGYGDNPFGNNPDAFPQDATQWADTDGDGFGDNPEGENPDPSIDDFDNDGYLDVDDPFPLFPSAGDRDNDKVLDEDDDFPGNFRESADNDGDGVGDNADLDDDNDGWLDEDELRAGSNPFHPESVPIEGFEVIVPGTAISLGAWDLIGMFGGIPLFAWIGFGFVTRNGRTDKYELLLREAESRDELESVAQRWEFMLMLRLIGPHQGFRLERLRSELDDRYEAENQRLSSLGPDELDQTEMIEQVMKVETMPDEQKILPSIDTPPPNIDFEGKPDGKGYEWHTDDGQETSWYRNEGSNSEWQRFDE